MKILGLERSSSVQVISMPTEGGDGLKFNDNQWRTQQRVEGVGAGRGNGKTLGGKVRAQAGAGPRVTRR